MTQTINDALYHAMYAVKNEHLNAVFTAARQFCAEQSSRPCPNLAHFVDDPANESISRELIRRLRDGTLLSGDNSVAESK